MKPGTKVKMSEQLKSRLRGNCQHDPEKSEEEILFCAYCSLQHVEEFGECIGVVLGNADLGGSEIDVRWEPSGLRYAYLPEDLEIVSETDL